MRRAIFLVFAASLVACNGPTPATDAGSEESAAVVRRLEPGDMHRYAFSWRVETASRRTMLGEDPVGGGLALAGELELRVLDEDEDGTRVAVRFARLQEHTIHVHGQEVLPEASVLVGHEAVVIVPADGATRRVLFEPTAPSIFRQMITGFLRHVDLRLPPRQPWRTVVATGNGLAQVEYVPTPGGRAFTRRVQRYERVDAVADLPDSAPWQTRGEATLVLADDGMPARLESEELLVLAAAEQPLAFDGHTHVTLSRIATERMPHRAAPDLSHWVEADLFDPPDDEEAERELARRFAEGLTMTDLTIVVQSAGRGLRPSPGFHIRARGLLRGWPELAAELAEMFDDAPSHLGRAFVLDLLVSADTPESQDVIVELLGRSPRQEDLEALLQHLGLVRTPTRATAELLLEIYRTARIEEDADIRQAVLYPMGSITPAIAASDPELGELLLATMRTELRNATTVDDRSAALSALGNAGFDADLDRILPHTSASEPAVRVVAVSALRFYAESRADDVVFAAVTDEARVVGAGALHVIEQYRPDDAAIERLARQVIAGDHHPELHGPIVSVLARRGIENPLARRALAALLERTEDARERRRIRTVLGTHT
jgi:hypothetical protein